MTYIGHVPPLALALIGWALCATLMAVLWLWHLRLRNVAVVDVGWALSLALLALLCGVAAAGAPLRRAVITSMVMVWSLRLALHLLRDRVVGRAEDARYTDLRQRNSVAAALKFFPFFQAQAILALVLALPVLIATRNDAPGLSSVEIAAVLLWAVAVSGETIADRQLERFKRRPDSRGRTCRDGLWRYSRHPNYFFEWLVWVSFALFALGSPGGVLAVTAPAVMLALLFRVTGIPATEAQALRSRGDEYRAYQASTSAFVPWFPKERA